MWYHFAIYSLQINIYLHFEMVIFSKIQLLFNELQFLRWQNDTAIEFFVSLRDRRSIRHGFAQSMEREGKTTTKVLEP